MDIPRVASIGEFWDPLQKLFRPDRLLLGELSTVDERRVMAEFGRPAHNDESLNC